jgi:hypothetical protein
MPRKKCVLVPPDPPTFSVEMPDWLTWSYELHLEGFKTKVEITHAGKIITLANILPWDDFIHGLATGWSCYPELHCNADLTTLLNSFIEQCIADGRYTPIRESKK